jgi:AcrR family transcriptional regulator
MATRDVRAQRSRERLHAALVALILERGWDRISVQAVCTRAGVGRSTFYVHFADKEDLLIGGLDHVRDAIRADPRSAKPFGFVRGMLDHADGSRRLFRAVIGKRSGLAVQRRFRAVVGELVARDLEGRGVGKASLVTTSRFLAGAFVELLLAWIEPSDRGDGVISAEALERRFVVLAAPVVAAALRS